MVARFPLWCPPVTSTVLPVIIFFVISCMMEWNCTVKKNEVKWNGTNSWLTKYKNNVRVVQYSSTPVLLHWSTKNERAEYWRLEEISWDFKLKKKIKTGLGPKACVTRCKWRSDIWTRGSMRPGFYIAVVSSFLYAFLIWASTTALDPRALS